MGEELIVRCNSNSSSRGSNRRQGQLEALRNTMKAIKAITSSFGVCLRGDNSRLDSLIDNVNFILEKQSCLNSGLEGGNDASEPMEISGSSYSVGAELESLKAGLLSIQLQVNAYRGLADDHGSLVLLLQNLDALIAKHSQVLPQSIRITSSVLPPIRPISSASKVKVEIIELEPDLPHSTIETFDIKPKINVATGVADGIISHNLNPVSVVDPKNNVSASTENSAVRGFASTHIEDVQLPKCSSFLPPSTSQNRKRKSDSNVNVDSRPNVASKTAKIVTNPGRSSSSTRPSRRSSREDNQINSDVIVKNVTFIQNNNVNLGKVKIEADYNPAGRHQNGKLIKEENSDDAAADDAELSDKSLLENGQQFSDRSLDLDVNSGPEAEVKVEVSQAFALDLPDEDTPTDQQPNSGNIFEQNQILTAIFKNVDVKNLKTVRSVNKQWKEIADARIIHENIWRLEIDKTFSKRHQGKTLDDLNDCIANSDGRFPLTTLTFCLVDSQCNNYSTPSLLRFYDLHGSKITSLILWHFWDSVGVLHDILLNRLPNIENIRMETIWFTKKGKLLTYLNRRERIALPNLKTIHFKLDSDPRNQAHQAFFEAFLTSAVNLKEIDKVHSHMLPCITRAGKLDCVKNFKFCPRIFVIEKVRATTRRLRSAGEVQTVDQPSDRASFEKLVELQPKLSTLKINVQSNKCRQMVPQYVTGLNKILQSSKDTLKRLKMPCVSLVPRLVLPNLTNLDRLDIRNYYLDKNLDPPAIFPGSLNIRETFPNVRIFSCDLVGNANETDWISKYFPVGNNNTGEGESSSSTLTIEMSRSFPSVTRLEFKQRHCFGKALEVYFPVLTNIICYKFDVPDENRVKKGANCGLRETTIGIKSLELRGFRLSGEKSRLDELFTGISRLQCVRLNNGDTHLAPLAGNCLLQNLKSLRRLKIVFDHCSNSKLKQCVSGTDNLVDEPDFACAVITPVSYLYAFEWMENLEEVIFAYDHDLPAASDFAKIFQPFAAFPCVKIVHEPNQTT